MNPTCLGEEPKYQNAADLCIDTAVTQRPRLTGFLTHRTHGSRVGFTYLFTKETQKQVVEKRKQG